MLSMYGMPGSLSESRQPESTRKRRGKPGMRPRPIDSFPGQPCRKGGGDGFFHGMPIRSANWRKFRRIVSLG
jgi:hypothetical protein